MTDTGSDELTLRFGPIADVILERHKDEWQEEYEEVPPGTYAEEYCRETAALVFVIAIKVIDQWKHYAGVLERASTRDQEKYRKLKEEKRELEEKVVELDRRLRDPNRLRPDPLGPSLPRGGQPDVVGTWCTGSGLVALKPKNGRGECHLCERTFSLLRNGKFPRHKEARKSG